MDGEDEVRSVRFGVAEAKTPRSKNARGGHDATLGSLDESDEAIFGRVHRRSILLRNSLGMTTQVHQPECISKFVAHPGNDQKTTHSCQMFHCRNPSLDIYSAQQAFSMVK